MRLRLVSILAAGVLLGGCASHVLLPNEERALLDRELVGKDRYLRLSYYVTPFFGDATKKLLTPVPPEEVRLLNHPSGEPVNPGPIEAIFPAGTLARVRQIEFPTAWAMTERVPYTPRTQPWVYLEVQGQPKANQYIVVLRPQIKAHGEFVAEFERYLAAEDPAATFSSWPDSVREAIRQKTALVDMPADALEIAWGYPERKKITFEESVKKEEWRYADSKRVAFIADGRVTKLDQGNKAGVQQSPAPAPAQ
jgi:hypothetical protein